MKKLAVIIDTWTSMYEDQKNGLDIFVVPLIILENSNKKVTEYRDYYDISQDELISKISENINITTSQPSIGNSSLKLADLLTKYEKILVIPVSKKISGTFGSWKSIIADLPKNDASRVYLEDFYDFGICLYDSVVEAINKFKDSSNQMELMIQFLNDRKDSFFGTFIVNDLNALTKSGRMSAPKAVIAKLLRKKITIGWSDVMYKLGVSSSIKKNVYLALEAADNKIHFIKKGIEKIYVGVAGNKNKKLLNEYKRSIAEFMKENNVSDYEFIKMSIPNTVIIHLGLNTLSFYIEARK